jgi:hypothetical protein
MNHILGQMANTSNTMIMKLLRKFTLFALTLVCLSATSCLDIEEEVTMRENGSGMYTLKMDMSQMKSMLEMMKGMGGETAETPTEITSDKEPQTKEEAIEMEKKQQLQPAAVDTSDPGTPKPDESVEGASGMPDTDLTKMGEEFAKSLEAIKGMKGIKNAVALNDTANLLFGYTFEFDQIETLNKAIVALNKDKFEGKGGNAFVATKKSFERTSAFDMGQLIVQAMGESDEAAESMDMIKMFFADMKYTQKYHFDRKVKKSNNADAEISADGKSVTLVARPFAEGSKTRSVVNVLKLK